jgi:hypothetical protein
VNHVPATHNTMRVGNVDRRRIKGGWLKVDDIRL